MRSPQMRVKKNHHQKGSLRRKVRQNGQNLLCYNLLCYQFCQRKDHFKKSVIYMYITVHKMQYITRSFSLNREMQQVARDITHLLKQVVNNFIYTLTFDFLNRINISVGNNFINKSCIILCKIVLF